MIQSDPFQTLKAAFKVAIYLSIRYELRIEINQQTSQAGTAAFI
jgi:hypothetical protein